MSNLPAPSVPTSDSLAVIDRMAQVFAKSGLFGCKTVEQAAALMLVAQAEGRHPASVAQDYHIIQNRPSLKADAVLARYLAAGGKVEWLVNTDKKCSARFTHPATGSVEIDWTIEQATKAGLTKNTTWTSYPRAMLRSRVISEGVRTSFPAVMGGFLTQDEAVDTLPDSPAATGPRTLFPGPTVPPVTHPKDADLAEPSTEDIPEADVVDDRDVPDAAPAVDSVAALVKLVDGLSEKDQESVRSYLAKLKWIGKGETVSDVSDEHAETILEKFDKFLVAAQDSK